MGKGLGEERGQGQINNKQNPRGPPGPGLGFAGLALGFGPGVFAGAPGAVLVPPGGPLFTLRPGLGRALFPYHFNLPCWVNFLAYRESIFHWRKTEPP